MRPSRRTVRLRRQASAKGDVIVAIDGVKIDNASAVQEQIAKHRPNDKVKITVKRDGAVKLFDVTLRNKAGKTELITREAVDVTAALGGKFRDAGTKLARSWRSRAACRL